MSIISKILADGRLPKTKGHLYVVPPNKTAYITWFSINNIGKEIEKISIFVKPHSVSRQIFGGIELHPNSTFMPIDSSKLVLNAGGAIEGFSTMAESCDFLIAGAEEDINIK